MVNLIDGNESRSGSRRCGWWIKAAVTRFLGLRSLSLGVILCLGFLPNLRNVRRC